MAEGTENLTVALSGCLGAKMARVPEDLRDLRHRMAFWERQTADLRGDVNDPTHRTDRIEARLGRIVRCSDLADAPAE